MKGRASGRRPCVAVTGVGGGVGQAILRALRHSTLEFRIIALDMEPRSPDLYASDGAYIVPAAEDPEYTATLERVVAAEGVELLFAGTDTELPVLARSRARLEAAGAKVVVGAPEPVDYGYDKLLGAAFFQDVGLPFVRTVEGPEGAALAAEIGYPLVVKPKSGSASKNVTVAFGPEDLAPYADRDDFIVQEYAVAEAWNTRREDVRRETVTRGGGLRQEDEISVQVLYDHERHHLGTFASVNRLRGGIPLFVDPAECPEVEDVAERMASSLVDRGLIGPSNFQCRLTCDGVRVFEVNTRFTGITGVRAAMGWNEVEAVVRRMLFDEPVKAVRASLRRRFDVVGMRYVDECLVPRAAFERLAT